MGFLINSFRNAAAGVVGAYDEHTNFGTIVGAWGVRLLVGAYDGGPLLRIRDTNDNSEQDVGHDGSGDLDSYTVVGDARVVKIYDQSGNGEDLIQSTAGDQPKLLATGSTGGKPIIDFTSGKYLECATSGTTRPYMVGKPAVGCYYEGGATGSYQAVFCIPTTLGSAAAARLALFLANSGPNFYREVNALASNLASSATLHAVLLNCDDAGSDTHYGFENNVNANSTSWTSPVTYPNSTKLRLGANGAVGEKFTKLFAELVIGDGGGNWETNYPADPGDSRTAFLDSLTAYY